MMIPAVLDHLWQSSLFAILAWAVTLLLRGNGAHLRYRIWLAASLKFLVPFSLLTLIGSQIGESVLAAPMNISSSDAVQRVAAALVAPATYLASSKAHGVDLTRAALLATWAFGFAAVVIRWLLRWRELAAIVRMAAPSGQILPIPVLRSTTLQEPGVFGIRRPVLLLPETIATQLDSGQLRAILEHELCHVRRRDNLTAAIHMLVEATFWFHPFVWWIGSRLVHERERACDEAVVRSGHRAETYAEAILSVCRHYVASKLTCVSGVSGADLETRLEAIMKTETIVTLGLAKRFLLATAGLAILAAPVFFGLTFPSPGEAQTAAGKTVSNASTSVGKIELIDGKRVRLKYQNADVRELLIALARAARVNILVSDKVSGTVTVDLLEMPWDQALTIVLGANGLVKRTQDGIIFIDVAGDAAA